MANFIELIAKIKQKNNGDFKLVDAQDVECEDGKGLDEALNEKLDKNLGAENTNKVLVTDEEGNVTTQNKEDFEGGGTGNYNDLENKPTINGVELSGNKTSKDLKMYTQEEVNYLLDDKMDKPYYDISITDDTTIENTLAGNFKIDSIEGSVYQVEESGIVPTPERPVPIRSKKITVNGEFVELRSLKESVNIFSLDDFYTTNKVNCTVEKITNGIRLSNSSGVRNSYIELDFSLKANKTYTVSFTADTTNSSFLDVVNCRILSFSASYWANPNWSVTIDNEKGIKSYQKTVTPTVDCKIYLHAMNLGISEQDGYVDFTNIMLVEGDSAPSSYVAPTVRDYKIVDHTTKTSKIVRNVKNIDLSSIGYQYQTGIDDKPYRVANYVYNLTSIQGSYKYIYANSEKVYSYNGFQSQMENGLCVSKHGIMRVVNGVTNEDELKTYVDNNRVDILYALATPTEESIPYVETDTSEVGLSWQDTTSPSPDIKSEIYEVDEINIKLVGKNLLEGLELGAFDNSGNYSPSTNTCVNKNRFIKVNQGSTYTFSSNGQRYDVAVYFYDENKNFVRLDQTGNAIAKDGEEYLNFVVLGSSKLNALNQLEEGPTATPYQEYQESSITHHLAKPLRATKDGSVRDAIDVVNMQITYNMTDFIVDGNTTIALGTDKEKTRVIQINNHPFLNPTNNLKMYCDKLLNDSSKDEELFTVSTDLFIGIDKNRIEANDINAFKKWFGENPLYFIGISKTPTTESLEDELVQKLKSLKTFSPVTHVFIEGIAKPKLNAKYPKDIAAAQQQLEAKVVTLQEAVIKNV